MENIKQRLEEVERRITAAAEKSGRKREDITLIAVTKTHGTDMINEAISCGATDIGENKPQDIRDKFDDVQPVKWHMIGHLQTNKIKYIIDKVCLIHSVDSIKLMDEIDKHAQKHGLVMDILIEVNISGEESKSGISPDELHSMLLHAGELKNIHVRGLMTVAPKVEENIKKDVKILGVTGTLEQSEGEAEPILEELNITPTNQEQVWDQHSTQIHFQLSGSLGKRGI